MFNGCDWLDFEFMGRSISWDEYYFIQIQGFSNRLRNDKMCIVGWIKCTAKETDLQGFRLTSSWNRFLRPLFRPECAFSAFPFG